MDCQKFFPWLMQIWIFSTIGIVFLLSITLLMLNRYFNDGGYLSEIMDENWKKPYIKDVIFQKATCQPPYNAQEIGVWSGFDGGIYVYVRLH